MSPALTILLSLVAGAAGAFFGAYLREKGKNFATKEDIQTITETQEKIRTELANNSHFSRARYDHEVAIYKNLWPKLINFYFISNFMDVRNDADQKKFHEIQNAVVTAIRDNKPFFSEEIYRELMAFEYLCEDKKFSEIVAISIPLTGDKADSYLKLQKQIQPQLEKVEKAIRDRLIKFD